MAQSTTAVAASRKASTQEPKIQSVGAGFGERYGKSLLVFVLLAAGYALSFSVDMNDALDTARWMENGNILRLTEFRHLVQRMLPLYIWLYLQSIDVNVSAMTLLSVFDFVSAALSIMLFYRLILDLSWSRGLSFAGSFAYATAHCIWIYTGSGRLYSTSMLFAFAGYYLALQTRKPEVRRYGRLALAAATMLCFASLFWMVHVFNAVGVGLMLLLLPKRQAWSRRFGYFAVYATAGILLTVLISVATMRFAEIPVTYSSIVAWVKGTETQPLKFTWQSPMNAAYGQAHGILVMYELPYMINGLVRHDDHLVRMASLPWQLGKFFFVWALLLLAYAYPLLMLRRASWELRAIIASLYVPLLMNVWFGLAWLGSDVQRFMPTMVSQFALAVLSVQHLLSRTHRPRLIAGILTASILLIAADNLLESLLPSQRRYISLSRQMLDLRPYVFPNDLLINYGRDITISYLTMTTYHLGARFLNLTNDHTRWRWDRPDWNIEFDRAVRSNWNKGGRVFVMDRLARGFNPPVAAFGERQHPVPTVKHFASFLQSEYCMLPAFFLEGSQYFEAVPRKSPCPGVPKLQAIERHDFLND